MRKTDKSIVQIKQGRVFTASLKPVWTIDEINNFISSMDGIATVWAVNHDKDFDLDGVVVEPHTHIVIDYKTPRRITTVSNLLKVEPNFVEVVRSKRGIIRYLTHADDGEKHQYDFDEVITNSNMSYADFILSGTFTDKDIADYILSGRGFELIGIVEPNRLGAIQRFLHYDSSNLILNEVRSMRKAFDDLLENINSIVQPILKLTDNTVERLETAMKQIAMSITVASNKVNSNTQRKRN